MGYDRKGEGGNKSDSKAPDSSCGSMCRGDSEMGKMGYWWEESRIQFGSCLVYNAWETSEWSYQVGEESWLKTKIIIMNNNNAIYGVATMGQLLF